MTANYGGESPHSGYPPEKICYSCATLKPIWQFYRRKYAKDGREAQCKECQRPNRAATRANSRDGGHLTSGQWRAILAFYRHACLCCGEVGPVTLDHVVPLAAGGRTEVGNVQPLCRDCNQTKGTKSIDFRPPVHARLLAALRQL